MHQSLNCLMTLVHSCTTDAQSFLSIPVGALAHINSNIIREENHQ